MAIGRFDYAGARELIPRRNRFFLYENFKLIPGTLRKREIKNEKSIPASKTEVSWELVDSFPHSVPTWFPSPIWPLLKYGLWTYPEVRKGRIRKLLLQGLLPGGCAPQDPSGAPAPAGSAPLGGT
jgi:hypothetical protein